MKKWFTGALCAVCCTLLLAPAAAAAVHQVTLSPEQAGSEVSTPLQIPSQRPAAVGEVPDVIRVTSPAEHAAISIPIQGNAEGADLLFLLEDGSYSAAEDVFAMGEHLYTLLPGTTAELIVLEKMPFSDLRRQHWYYGACFWAYHNGLMSGASATTFSPTAAATRAQLVTILWRKAGMPAHSGSISFTDVAEGKYYTDAVLWAGENGIVTGSGGAFDPNGSMTRAQLAAMLYRYAAYCGMDTTARADLSAYTDAKSVAAWAQDAMAWTAAEGLITGDTRSQLLPGGTANRAQLATILMRLFAA